MKGLHLRLIILAAIPLLACCEEAPTVDTTDVPLSFSTSVEAQTRGSDLTTDNLTSMGVFAFFTQGGSFNASTSKPNLLYNQEVTKAAGASSPWTYSPTRYWPANSTDKVSFFAYAPYNASGVTVSAATQAGYPKLTYTVPAAEATQADLLAAVPLMDKNKEAISFNLKHTLTKVTLIVKNGDSDGSPKTVNSLSLKAKASGTLTYSSTTFSWGSTTGTTTYTPVNSTDIAVPTVQNGTVKIATFYLLPDNAGATISLKYTMEGNIETGGTAPAHTITVTDKAIGTSLAWNAGGAVAYTITLNKTGLEVAATGDTWEQGTSNEVDVTTAGELKIGDYYYDDGTWSDGGARGINTVTGEVMQENPLPEPVLTNPKTGTARTWVGIIFYTGRHPLDEGVYLNQRGNPMEVKGYVLALSQIDGGYWGNATAGSATNTTDAGTKKAEDDFNGYYNTEQMKAASDWGDAANYTLAKGCINHSAVTDAEKCSPWFMPSLGQLLQIGKVMTFLDKTLDSHWGTSFPLYPQSVLCSSTEASNSEIQVAAWGTPPFFFAENKSVEDSSRAILAFTY